MTIRELMGHKTMAMTLRLSTCRQGTAAQLSSASSLVPDGEAGSLRWRGVAP